MRCQERHHPHHHLILITIITNLVNTFIIRSALHCQHTITLIIISSIIITIILYYHYPYRRRPEWGIRRSEAPVWSKLISRTYGFILQYRVEKVKMFPIQFRIG